jgi:hypothetical protein
MQTFPGAILENIFVLTPADWALSQPRPRFVIGYWIQNCWTVFTNLNCKLIKKKKYERNVFYSGVRDTLSWL